MGLGVTHTHLISKIKKMRAKAIYELAPMTQTASGPARCHAQLYLTNISVCFICLVKPLEKVRGGEMQHREQVTVTVHPKLGTQVRISLALAGTPRLASAPPLVRTRTGSRLGGGGNSPRRTRPAAGPGTWTPRPPMSLQLPLKQVQVCGDLKKETHGRKTCLRDCELPTDSSHTSMSADMLSHKFEIKPVTLPFKTPCPEAWFLATRLCGAHTRAQLHTRAHTHARTHTLLIISSSPVTH